MPSTLALLALLSPVVQAAVPNVNGFSLEWSDDFSGAAGSLPDSANWLMTTGTSYPGGAANFGTGEIETYTSNPENCQTDGNGNLKITAIKSGSAWTSSRIETQRKDFMAQPGGKMRIQASLSLPKVDNPIGYWPAFWTLGAKFRGVFTNWPGVGEFDVMENVNGINQLFGTLHCGTAPGGPCHENDGISGNVTGDEAKPLQGNFHEFAFEVDRTTASAGQLKWFLDGRQYHQVRQGEVEADAWANAVEVPHFLLMNLAIGGSFPNKLADPSGAGTTPREDTTSGGVFAAEYVAVYYASGGGANGTDPGGSQPPPTATASASASNPPTAPPTAVGRRRAGPAMRRML